MCPSPFRLHFTALNYAGLQASFPPFTPTLHSRPSLPPFTLLTVRTTLRHPSPFIPPPLTLRSRPSLCHPSPCIPPVCTRHSPTLHSRPSLCRPSLALFTTPPVVWCDHTQSLSCLVTAIYICISLLALYILPTYRIHTHLIPLSPSAFSRNNRL
jgi:hypothetical protein